MNASTAITELYQLDGEDFDRRFNVMALNIKRQLLEDFITSPLTDSESTLQALSAALIETQKTACHSANISPEQTTDFETRIDNCLADAVIVIRDQHAKYGDTMLPEFQLEAARQLGIPVG